MAAIIRDAARVTAEAMPLLRNISKNGARLHELTERLVRMEGHADEIHASGLRRRFTEDGERDTMKFLVAREISSISNASSTGWKTSRMRLTASSSTTPDTGRIRTAADARTGISAFVGLIALALAFDFLNGLHDAANSIATIVTTVAGARHLWQVLSPRRQFCRLLAGRPACRRDRGEGHR